MKKVWIGLLIVVLIALFGGRAWYSYTQRETEKPNEKVIKIGAILPLSSNMAKTGKEILESLKIAENNINNDPQYSFKVKIIVEDGKHQARASLDAFHKLIAQKIDTMIVFSDEATAPLVRFINDNKMQTLVIGGRPFGPYTFTVPVSNETLLYAYGKYVANKMHLKRIGIIYLDSVSGKQTTDAFIKGATEKGSEITSIEKYKDGAMETKTQVLKALDKDPDALFVFGWGDNSFPATINYIRELGYKKPILSHFVIPSALPYLKDKSNIHFVDLTLQPAHDTYGYAAAYRQKFDGADPDMMATFNYIAAHMIANVANKVGTENPELFMKEVKTLPSFETPYGQMKIIDEKTYLPMFAKKILPDGTIEVIEEIKE